ncbi:MAG: SLBB domain-containing protein [Flavobacteriaceae bacterium]|nr:SLBB domain-containing protein [Flavobacteriaceae bacterium]
MTKKYLLYFLLFTKIFGQVSIDEINTMSNGELDLLRSQLLPNNQMLEDNQIVESFEETTLVNPNQDVKGDDEDDQLNYFGYSYFEREVNFFNNVPTPRDYQIGPGDEIILSMWGETNLREKFIINKEGLIYYENIGFINLSNKTMSESEDILKNELSKIYATIKSNTTNLTLELGQIKSINVYFSGMVENPGIHLIHPFSDIFTALVQAGGIKQEGSLRSIKIIRKNKEIANVDFYNFFLSGINNFDDLKLINGDVIHIPPVKNRVEILGEIVNGGLFELKSEETVSDLVKYAGGFTELASQSAVLTLVVPLAERLSDDNAVSSKNLELNDFKNIILNNGDSIDILTIPGVESFVEVFGRVKNPGIYSSNSSLRDVLSLAGGFSDPIFRKSIIDNKIVILRKDESQFYAKELVYTYKDSENVSLMPEDKIFVYENINYRNSYTYTVVGEVNKPGTYPLKKGITLQDAIEIAGGLTEISSYKNITVKQEITETFNNEEKVTLENVSNLSNDFELGPNSVINALPFENVIRVEGNVYDPGLVAYIKGMTMYNAIDQAGGYKPFSLKKRVYVKRANGEIDKSNILRGRGKRVFPGDSIFVPVNENTEQFDITRFIANLSTTLANLAAIIVVINNN